MQNYAHRHLLCLYYSVTLQMYNNGTEWTRICTHSEDFTVIEIKINIKLWPNSYKSGGPRNTKKAWESLISGASEDIQYMFIWTMYGTLPRRAQMAAVVTAMPPQSPSAASWSDVPSKCWWQDWRYRVVDKTPRACVTLIPRGVH